MTGDEYQPRSPYLVGPPIQTVDGFYGRRMQIDSFFENLNRPQLCSQRILGARRSGKTSFLRHVSNPKIHTGRIRTPGLPVIFAYVDLQGIATEPTALPHARALHDHRRSGPDRTGPMLFFREVASAIAVAAPSGKKIRVPKTFRDSASFDTWLGGIGRRFRLVVLLDEFETLVRSDVNIRQDATGLGHGLVPGCGHTFQTARSQRPGISALQRLPSRSHLHGAS
jgi:hypothetical protein